MSDPSASLLELQVLQRVASLGCSSLDLEAVLRECVDLACEVTRTGSGVVYLRDEARGVYHRYAARAGLPEEIHLPSAEVERLFAGGSPVTIDLRDPALAGHEAVRAAAEAGFCATVHFALRHRGQLVGLIVVGRREPGRPDDARLAPLEAITGHLAAIIENARAHLLARLQAQLSHRLRDFAARALAPKNDDELYALVLDTAISILGSDRALLAHKVEGGMQVIASAGLRPIPVGRVITFTSDETRSAMRSGEPLVIEDVPKVSPEAAREHQTGSFVMLPLLHRGLAVGILGASSDAPKRYRTEEVDAARVLGSMAAQAIERAHAEAREHEQHRLVDALIEELPSAVVVFARGGQEVLRANRAARLIAERFDVPIDGRADLTTFAPDGAPIPPEARVRERVLAGEKVTPHEVILQHVPSGTRLPVLIGGAPLLDLQGQVIAAVVTAQDVTVLRDLADAKDRFLRIASHELRSPITSLRATTQLLTIDPTAFHDPERRHALLERIDRQTARLVQLVERLLDSARLGTSELKLELQPTELTALCRRAVEAARVQEPRLSLELPPGELVIEADSLRIEQAVDNLISNALRYSGVGSEVAVRLRGTPGHAEIEVEDRGIGIPAPQLEQVFSPFFRASNAAAQHRGGLGLGLHITREIARRHGGEIGIRSQEGAGTVVVLTLPRR